MASDGDNPIKKLITYAQRCFAVFVKAISSSTPLLLLTRQQNGRRRAQHWRNCANFENAVTPGAEIQSDYDNAVAYC